MIYIESSAYNFPKLLDEQTDVLKTLERIKKHGWLPFVRGITFKDKEQYLQYLEFNEVE